MKKYLMLLAAAAVLELAAEPFRIGAVNCGAFHYGVRSVTEGQYAAGWEDLATNRVADVFFYEDVGTNVFPVGSVGVPGLDIRAVLRGGVGELSVIELPRTIEAEGKTCRTPRYRALRVVREWKRRKLACYGLHLVAEGHIKGPRPAKGGLSFAQQLRQEQFKALLADARQFDFAVFAGDFNAQKASEYDIFREAGYSIANGSEEFGTIATLRNIPADNIVISPGLAIAEFEVPQYYRINTDHFPVIARIDSSAAVAKERELMPSVAEYFELPLEERRKWFANSAFRIRMKRSGRVCGTGVLSRWVEVDGVPNLRDAGGLQTVDGNILKRGLLYRSAGWNDNAKTYDDKPESEWVKGKCRVTALGREQMKKLGIRTDLDLRGKWECWGMDGSPLGGDVAWKRISFGSYGRFRQKPEFRAAVKEVFEVLADEANYPLVFHCIGGADRTGCLALMIQELCGVDEDTALKDWELTGNRTDQLNFTHAKAMDRFLDYLREFPGDTPERRMRAFLAACGVTEAQMEAVRRILLPAPSFTISIPPDPAPSVRYAAEELRDHVTRLNGRMPVIVTEASPRKGVSIAIDPKSDDDSFEFHAKDGLFRVTGGKRGVLYGVYELLERFGGIEFVSSWYTYFPEDRTFRIPRELDERHVPAFPLRENLYGDVMKHFDYAVRLRLNGLYSHDNIKPHPVDEKLGGKGYPFVKGLKNCHTLKFLMPVEKYFKDHPEYYALVEGIRRDVTWQLCYSNPDVLKICTEKVLEFLAADPTAAFVGVSHNDNSGCYCRCEKCAAIDAEEESHAGTELRFVNAIADQVKKRYPHVLVQTLAYQYTRKPPKLTKPRDNVVITLCSIECDRLCPFGAADSAEVNREFERDLLGWAKLTDKLYVWDYTGENLHYFYPMPNAHNVYDNVKYFRDHNVKFMFVEGNGWRSYHPEFSILKSWLISKAMWNPDEPLEGLLDRFFNAYYGAAAPYARAYYELEKQVAGKVPADTVLTIYQADSRTRYPDEFLDRALELWNQAEKAVLGDPCRRYNVRMDKASIVRLKLDRLTDGVKWVWVTRDPGRFAKADPLAAEYEKYMLDIEREAIAAGHPVRFGNTPQRDLRPRQQWRRYNAAVRPERGTGRVSVGVDDMGITEIKFASVVSDPDAIDGRAVEINNRYEEPGPYLEFRNIAYDPGVKYRVRVHAKVTPLENGRGQAIRLKAGEQEISRDVKELERGYVWYEFEPFVPKGHHKIEVRPGHRTAKDGGGRMAIESIRVDRFEIERAE